MNRRAQNRRNAVRTNRKAEEIFSFCRRSQALSGHAVTASAEGEDPIYRLCAAMRIRETSANDAESNNSYNQPDRLNPNQSPLHTTAIVPTATP